jgi:hypothetical protein
MYEISYFKAQYSGEDDDGDDSDEHDRVSSFYKTNNILFFHMVVTWGK